MFSRLAAPLPASTQLHRGFDVPCNDRKCPEGVLKTFPVAATMLASAGSNGDQSAQFGTLLAMWGVMTNRRIGWLCLAVSFLPIVAMTVVSGLSDMASRVLLSGVVGAVAGVLLLIGLVEAFHAKAETQTVEP